MQKRWTFLLKTPAEGVFFEQLRKNLEHWKAHGAPVVSKMEVINQQIILLEAITDVSGCGIDSMIQILHKTAEDFAVEIQASSYIAFDLAGIFTLHFKDVPAALIEGKINAETMVYDFPAWIQGGLLKRELKNTWLARYLPEKV
jgi:hypothetical protein